jgi:hypothetical protein
MPNAEHNPLAEAQSRLADRELNLNSLQRRHRFIGNVRLGIFLVFIVLCWFYVRTSAFSAVWLVVNISVFVWLVLLHQKVVKEAARLERSVFMYRRSIARMEDRWSGDGVSGADFRRPDHLYSEDLNILGDGSLFQLLCVARSPMGQACLADWLLGQAALPEIALRQAAVRELAQRLDLRERIATAGEEDRIAADPHKLSIWASAEVDLKYRGWWPLAALLAVLAVSSFLYAAVTFLMTGSTHWSPFVLLLVLNGLLMFRWRHGLEAIFRGLDGASHNLDAVAALVAIVEAEKFSSPLLQELQSRFHHGDVSASEGIARLGSLCDLENSRLNIVLRALDLPLLFSLQVGFALQRWRQKYAQLVDSWMNALGQMEALMSLAAFAYEHPQDSFPEFNDPGVPLGLAAESLGHPLIAAAACVRNHVRLGDDRQLVMISGSNMSGKSTLLRAVGMNTVLAMAGATVRSQRMRLSPVVLGASINISDSLQKGVSHFYAEISRIRAVVDLAAQGPLLFLFDEILQGTNSHDRRVGTQGVVSTLLKRNAIGLITTHDLSLTELINIFPHQVTNLHFQEKLEAGKLSFDYTLRPGVVTTSNGVELMRSIGLEV